MPSGLSFRIPGKNFAKNDINKVVVTLDPSDTYTVSFLRTRANVVKEISTHSDVYNDSLVEVFEHETGLRTRL